MTRARAGLTAERVTTSAADLADELGFDAVTVAELARRLGVRDASLYSHVPGLAELRTRVTLLALAELADLVADAVAGHAGTAALMAFAGTHRRYALDHPGRYTAMQQPLDPATAAASAAPRHGQLTIAVLRGYSLAEPAQTDAARLVLATLHGFLGLERSGGFSHRSRATTTSFTRAFEALDVVLTDWPRRRTGA